MTITRCHPTAHGSGAAGLARGTQHFLINVRFSVSTTLSSPENCTFSIQVKRLENTGLVHSDIKSMRVYAAWTGLYLATDGKMRMGEKWNPKMFVFSQTIFKKSLLLICPYIIWKGDNISIWFFFTFSRKRLLMSPLWNGREDKSYKRYTKANAILTGDWGQLASRSRPDQAHAASPWGAFSASRLRSGGRSLREGWPAHTLGQYLLNGLLLLKFK